MPVEWCLSESPTSYDVVLEGDLGGRSVAVPFPRVVEAVVANASGGRREADATTTFRRRCLGVAEPVRARLAAVVASA